jgi:hypothetical protein
MSTAEHKARARRLVEACYNSGNLAVMDEVLALDFGNHDPAESQVRKLGRKKWSRMQVRPKSQE